MDKRVIVWGLRAFVLGLALLNLAIDGLLILPNLYLWNLNHEWISLAAVGIIAWVGLGVLSLAVVASVFAGRLVGWVMA